MRSNTSEAGWAHSCLPRVTGSAMRRMRRCSSRTAVCPRRHSAGARARDVSNGIRQLEEELGARLFDRTTRTVRLTELGEHLLPYVREVLNAQQMLLSETNRVLH